jgi:hypothetical protein
LAATITFQAGVNGYDHLGLDIRENAASNNGPQTLVGYQSGVANVHQIRSLLSFSLASIPAGSTINSITLTLVSDGNQSGNIAGVGSVNLHEVVPNGVATNNFTEAQTTWANWGTGGVGTPWTAPGGDFGSALTTATINNTNANTVLDAGETATFNTSIDFVAAAQAAFNAGLPLELILVAPTAEANTAASNFFRFRSEDFTTAIGDRPLLTIDYTIPEPTSALIALLAGVPFVARRRR